MFSDSTKVGEDQTSGLRRGELLWKEPTEAILVEILHNPAYAGTFV